MGRSDKQPNNGFLYFERGMKVSHLQIKTVASKESDIKNYYCKEDVSKLCECYYKFIHDAVAIVDFQGNVISVNAAFEKLYGFSEQEIVGKLLPVIKDESLQKYHCLLEDVLRGEIIEDEKMILRTKQNQYIPVESVMAPFTYQDTRVCIFITKDMIERLELEVRQKVKKEMTRLEEKLLLDLIKGLNEAICLYDVNHFKPIFINPYIQTKWGIEVDSFYKQPGKLLNYIKKTDKKRFIHFFNDKSMLKREMEFEFIKDGTSYWLSVEITPLIENERVNKHISVFKDITEIRNQSNKIKELDQLGVIGQLAAGIAHEVKNPLTSVKGFIQLLAEKTDSEYAEIITSEIERIEFIMQEFLILAKPRKDIQFCNENLSIILNQVCSFMSAEAMMYDIDIQKDIEPNILVECEPQQIKQVIINLIKNGIEAMQIGGKLFVHLYRETNDEIVIEVIDEGKGMCKEILKRFKEPFFSSKEKGTGLGVMICYKIIEDHKGRIDYFSEEGKGTMVRIVLPTC